MARTLVIKNADFSANKVATVTFASIPCTAITFTESTYTITSQSPVEVEYTLTPSDTTDTVTWNSSDTDVVTISAGVMTIVGIGSATITATCNGHVASASVTVSIAWIPTFVVGETVGLTQISGINVFSESVNATRFIACGSGVQASTYTSINQSGANRSNAIKIPKNTGKIRISITDGSSFYNSTETRVFWCKDIDAQIPDPKYTNAILGMSVTDKYNIKTETTKDFAIPNDGTDSFFVNSRLTSDATQQLITASGFNITFIEAE